MKLSLQIHYFVVCCVESRFNRAKELYITSVLWRYDIGMLSCRNSYAHPSPCKSKNSNSQIVSIFTVSCKSVIGL